MKAILGWLFSFYKKRSRKIRNLELEVNTIKEEILISEYKRSIKSNSRYSIY